MVYMLQCNAATQSVLPDYSSISTLQGKGRIKDNHLKQSQLPFAAARPKNKRKITQEKHLKRMALNELGMH